MATKQSRKSVSISGETYLRVQTHCQEHGSSVSGFIEMLVAEFFRNADVITQGAPKKKEKQAEKEVEEGEPPAKPFVMNGLKKEPPTITKDSIRGGGVHSL